MSSLTRSPSLRRSLRVRHSMAVLSGDTLASSSASVVSLAASNFAISARVLREEYGEGWGSKEGGKLKLEEGWDEGGRGRKRGERDVKSMRRIKGGGQRKKKMNRDYCPMIRIIVEKKCDYQLLLKLSLHFRSNINSILFGPPYSPEAPTCLSERSRSSVTLWTS